MTEVLHDIKVECLRLIQITDSHLYEDVDGTLVGVKCEETFRDVIDLVSENESRLDAVLCTGDIAQDASIAAYSRFHDAVATLNAPQYWIPGNHDLMDNMHAALSGNFDCLHKSFSMANWQIIMLNSCVEGQVYGHLAETELAFLEHELQHNQSRHIMICLHHNCVPVQADWLQKHCLKNSAEFLSVVRRHDNVRVVVFGHIHQEMKVTDGQMQILGSPSASIQFHPVKDEFTVDVSNPGYRWFNLYTDGSMESGVKRVTGKQYDIDFSMIGY